MIRRAAPLLNPRRRARAARNEFSCVSDAPYNVLFLCTGNSARSIMAEAILNKLGAGRFRAYSAGSHPRGSVHPVALELLQSLYDTRELRSKSWHALADAPQFDFILTVCDNAAAEVCPVWPGHPVTAHWCVADPAEVNGRPAVVAHAFYDAYRMLHQRIATFTSLPLRTDQLTVQTSFANPAVTLARALSDTFAGIAPGGVSAFIGAQLMGMVAAVIVGRWLWPHPEPLYA
jgi:arsenate reductase (thioredoxin)